MSSHAISSEGLALIRAFEGFRAEPAQLPDGNWVVGHGHVRIGEAGAALTVEEAGQLLALDLAPVERSVNANVTHDISQAQFDALVSFAFSVGVEAFEQSAVLRRVNTGAFVAAACAMDAWRKSDVGGELEIIDALVRRRAAEKALFLQGQPVEAAPSAFVRAKLDHAAAILGAPVDYAATPEVGSIPFQAKAEPGQRITEILKSEAATEALLLTRVATDEEIAAEDEGELVTAHAKPVARMLDVARRSARAPEPPRKRFAFPKLSFILSRSVEGVGLIALLVFGAALTALGGSTLINASGDSMEILGAAALITPGVAAVLMAAYGLWKGPAAKAA